MHGTPAQRPKGPVRPSGPFRFFEPHELTEKIVTYGEVGTALTTIKAQMDAVDEFIECGIDPPTRVLFVGPSGTGKTLAARTIAAAMQLPICVSDLSSFVASHLGETSSNIATAFRVSKAEGALLFLDEIDGVQQSRATAGSGECAAEMMRATTTFFQQLDWAPKRQLIIAATNFPEHLDPALFRRFTTVVTFTLPQGAARERLVKGWLAKVPDVDPKAVRDLCAADLSCADLRAKAMDLGRAAIMRRRKAS